MEVTGKIKKIEETKTFGTGGFRKREMVLTTNDQYPQMLKIEFVQDKCDLLNNVQIGQDVKISINLTGREWINPQGEAVYFNAIQGWRVEADGAGTSVPPMAPLDNLETTSDLNESEPDDLPF